MKIEWVKVNKQYETGHTGYIGRVKIFWLHWSMFKGDKGEQYNLTCKLPGVKPKFDVHTEDEGMKLAETIWEHWTDMLIDDRTSDEHSDKMGKK